MKKHLYLHIGSNKTGTTSSQITLHHNRRELLKQGYLYPCDVEKHHTFFFATKSARKYWPRALKHTPTHELKRKVEDFFSTLEKEISIHDGHLVLSTEYLFIDQEAHIQSVIDYLKPFYPEITVIVFVREPADLYASGQQQILKARSYATPPQQFHYNFKNVIESWSRFCPVIVKEYSPGTDSCEVLCNTIGIDYSRMSRRKRVNTTMSVEQVALLEKIRRIVYKEEENVFKHHLRLIHKVRPAFTNKPKLKEEVKRIIRDTHKADLEWLKKQYDIDFTVPENSDQAVQSRRNWPEKQVSVRDIYEVCEESVELYETALMDRLIKQLMN